MFRLKPIWYRVSAIASLLLIGIVLPIVLVITGEMQLEEGLYLSAGVLVGALIALVVWRRWRRIRTRRYERTVALLCKELVADNAALEEHARTSYGRYLYEPVLHMRAMTRVQRLMGLDPPKIAQSAHKRLKSAFVLKERSFQCLKDGMASEASSMMRSSVEMLDQASRLWIAAGLDPESLADM